MATSPVSRERYAPEVSPPLIKERAMTGSTVAMIEPTRAGGKAESDGTVPQTRPVKATAVNKKGTGCSGTNPTQPSIPHSRPDTQEKEAASHAHRNTDAGSRFRLKNRRAARTRMAVSRYSAPSHPTNQLAGTVFLSTYAAAREMRTLEATTPSELRYRSSTSTSRILSSCISSSIET